MKLPVSDPARTGDQPPAPRKLAFLTIPLLIVLFYNAISLLTIPFSGDMVEAMVSDLGARAGEGLPALSPALVQTVLWLAFALTALILIWVYLTRRAVLEGRAWGRISSIVIGVLSLLVIPFGTILGILILFGAFEREVTAYLRR